ncbi:MAG: exonuclease SbcCD subunit D [Candidatus Onthomonas sp.]
MKFLHLSDLHLGKRLLGCSLLEDQRSILEQLLPIAKEADAVLIAGDVYDKAVPSAEAVALCDWFLTSLASQGTPVLLISGNHDSAQRLSFGARLMEGGGIHIAPVFSGAPEPVLFRDRWGEVAVYLLPFLKPVSVRQVYPEEEISSYQDALACVLSHMPLDPNRRNLLVAHQYVAGARQCQSEEVSIGGLDQVDAGLFDAFDYVALGHLHTPQWVGRETVRYCGTPLKYSFSEAGQDKSALLVTLEEKGAVWLEQRPLTPLRELSTLRGTYLELTDRRFYQDRNTQDYLHIVLTDEEDIPQALGRLRTVYPNLLSLEYDNRRTRSSQTVTPDGETHRRSPLELLADFYETQNNQPMGREQLDYAARLMTRIWEEEL